MKRFYKRMLKGLGLGIIALLIYVLANFIFNLIYIFSPVLWWILVGGLLLFCFYQMAD